MESRREEQLRRRREQARARRASETPEQAIITQQGTFPLYFDDISDPFPVYCNF